MIYCWTQQLLTGWQIRMLPPIIDWFYLIHPCIFLFTAVTSTNAHNKMIGIEGWS
jgi:hypothetical protein